MVRRSAKAASAEAERAFPHRWRVLYHETEKRQDILCAKCRKKISRTFAALAPFHRRNADKVPEGAREVLRRGEPEHVGGVLHRKAVFKKSLRRLYPALKKESCLLYNLPFMVRIVPQKRSPRTPAQSPTPFQRTGHPSRWRRAQPARRRRRAARTFASSFPAKGVNGAARTFWMSPISASAAFTPFRNPLWPWPSP